jgi:hypothetical protein
LADFLAVVLAVVYAAFGLSVDLSACFSVYLLFDSSLSCSSLLSSSSAYESLSSCLDCFTFCSYLLCF